MAKTKTFFECIECGHQESRWLGRCPQCGAWNTMEEISLSPHSGKGKIGSKKAGRETEGPLPLQAIEVDGGFRFDAGMKEINRVLGGGIMKGSSILLGGEPGIGKSTLMMQLSGTVKADGKILYVSGEESAKQIKMRADRVGVTGSGITILIETTLELLLEEMEKIQPAVVILDSIQTVVSEEAGKVPGTVNQIKYCGHELITWSKLHGSALFFVAHVTKEGVIAGPKVLEHMVDTVLYFDHMESGLRVIRAVKNRFGSIDELGLFIMKDHGLEEVRDPSSLFLVKRKEELPPGITAVPVYEGTRVLIIEIQALTVPSKSGFSRIYSDKIDTNRISRIAAVLEKHTTLKFSDQDIYVNVAGGIRLSEVGIDLAVASALYSARTGIPFPSGTAVVGELSLAGEILPTSHMDRRIKTAADMGFSRFIGPSLSESVKTGKSKYQGVSRIKECIQTIFRSGV